MVRDSRKSALLRTLSDGRFHSGEELAALLGITRSAIWKRLRSIASDHGLRLDTVRGKGYRLADQLEMLCAESIRSVLSPQARAKVGPIHVHDTVDSTNTWLMNRALEGASSGTVCIAETQSAGRGRHGKSWFSPYGANLYLSILWRFDMAPSQLLGLSLAGGVAVARILHSVGLEEIALKWPNDILWKRRKLGGVLLEVGGEACGPSYVVAGIGLNLRMPERASGVIDQPWVDIFSISKAANVSRNETAGRLIEELLLTMELFAQSRFSAFKTEWSRYDCYNGEAISLRIGSKTIVGDYLGVSDDGSIQLRVDGKVCEWASGEVSLCRSSE